MKTTGTTLHLHIGLPKTATTFLQSSVFPQMESLRVSCTPPPAKGMDGCHSLTEWALNRDPGVWRGGGPDLFEGMLGPREAWQGRDALVSDERIGRVGSRTDHLADHLRAIAKAARSEDFGRTACICAVRRQDDWFASHYAQMSDRNPWAGQKDFERSVDDFVNPGKGGKSLGRLLHYDRLHARLIDALGAENVFFFCYETMRETPDAFARQLAGFLGHPASLDKDGGDRNERNAGARKWALRRYDRRADTGGRKAGSMRIALEGLTRLRPRGTGAIELTPELSARILDAYRPSNCRLADASGADLERHGYC